MTRNLKVLDQTAASMAKDNKIDIVIFNILEDDSLKKVIENDIPHTVITTKE